MTSERDWQSYRTLLARYAPNAIHEQYSYVDRLKELVEPGMTWLDAGCGHNVIAPWVNAADSIEDELLSRAKLVIGCDVDAVSLVKESPIRRVACNLEQLAFADQAFDLISCNMVVEHLQDPKKVFREFFRALKPGGKVLILTPNVHHWTMMISHLTPHWVHVWARKKLFGSSEEDVFPTVYRSNTPSALPTDLKEAGFKRVELELLASRPHLVGMGPLLFLEFILYEITLKLPKLREILCAVAYKD